jgi:CheY-like chemotaxis protein
MASRLGIVVIVEDDAVIALALEEAMRDAGAERVITIACAAEAMAALADVVPTVLVLDLSLSDSEDGYGVAEVALELFHPPPQVFFSTGSPERIPPHLAKRGMIFTKPYDPADLARKAATGAG